MEDVTMPSIESPREKLLAAAAPPRWAGFERFSSPGAGLRGGARDGSTPVRPRSYTGCTQSHCYTAGTTSASVPGPRSARLPAGPNGYSLGGPLPYWTAHTGDHAPSPSPRRPLPPLPPDTRSD